MKLCCMLYEFVFLHFSRILLENIPKMQQLIALHNEQTAFYYAIFDSVKSKQVTLNKINK